MAARLPRGGRQPRPRARAPAGRRLATGARQDLRRQLLDRLRPLGRAAARGVDGKAGQGARARTGRAAGGARPPARSSWHRRPVRPRRRALPLGVRHRRRGPRARDQPLRPAGRPGGEGQDERGPGRRRARRRARAARSTSCSRRRRPDATTSASRRSSTPPARASWRRSSSARTRPAASSREASARATCTRPASCTRAARTPACSSRSSTTPATSCRSRAATSASAG